MNKYVHIIMYIFTLFNIYAFVGIFALFIHVTIKISSLVDGRKLI